MKKLHLILIAIFYNFICIYSLFAFESKQISDVKLTGTLSSSTSCALSNDQTAQLGISIGDLLLFQSEIPIGGSYEFRLIPGSYNLMAIGENACFAIKKIKISTLQNVNYKLNLISVINNKHIGPVSEIHKQKCDFHCIEKLKDYSPVYNMDKTDLSKPPWTDSMPWWWVANLGLYSNAYAPAPWEFNVGNTGIISKYYTGKGQIFVPQSHIYFSNEASSYFNFKLEKNNNKFIKIFSSPKSIEQDLKIKTEGLNFIQIEGINYSFINYAYQLDVDKLQDQKGFCSPRKNVVGEMAQLLHKLNFSEQQIIDFMTNWSLKFPIAKSFCIYPQDEKNLESYSSIKTSYNLAFKNRILFIVKNMEDLTNSTNKKFSKAPSTIWNPPNASHVKTHQLEIHEWGVGFFMVN